MIDPYSPSDADWRIELFAGQRDVTTEDVVELWTREGVLSAAEARRRVGEILLVAVDEHQRPVGVSTVYLQHNSQLRAELWYFRAFVAASRRQGKIAETMALIGRDHLTQRFVSGEDRRGIGIIYEVESGLLKHYFPQALWQPTRFLFIGENERGDHVRVWYFPGALAPEPDQGNT